MRKLQHVTPIALLFFLTSATTSCNGLSGGDPYDYDPCGSLAGPTDVSGSWSIEGRGTRSGCDDERLDGEITLRTGVFVVEMDETSGQITMGETITVPGGSFTVSGTVDGTCVDFTAYETGSAGDFDFDFDGTVENNRISGDFTGSGPAGCYTTGTFEVDL